MTSGTSITASYALTGVLSLTGSDTWCITTGARQRQLYTTSQNRQSGADRAGRLWRQTARSQRDTDHTVNIRVTTPGSQVAARRGESGRQRRRQPEPRVGNGVDHQRLAYRRYAGGVHERHQHHHQLQRLDRRAEPDRQRHAGALPAGARQRQLLVDQPKSDQLWR